MGNGYSMRASGSGTAELFLYEDIGEGWFGGVSAKQFAEDLKALGSVNTIDVRINSYGGEVFDGLAIYRQLVEHPARIVVHIDGVAASIASVIAMAGDEIRIAQAGFVMIHAAQGGVMGAADDMRSMADLLDKITASIVNVYEKRTGAATADIEQWISADTWFTAQDALDAGFCDAIDENMLLAAHAGIDQHREKFRSGVQAAAKRRPTAQEMTKLRDTVQMLEAAPEVEKPNLAVATAAIERMRARLTLSRPEAQTA